MVQKESSTMIVEFFVLTLFLCPSNVKVCPPNKLLPAKHIKFESFSECGGVGKTLVDLKEFDDYSCRRHEK